jgi:hypothetical protein
MCEHCSVRRSWTTELDPKEVLPCEYLEDLGQDDCPAPAIALVTGRYVEDHLCRDCAEAKKETGPSSDESSASADAGPGDFLNSHGFQKGVEFLEIMESVEECAGESCGNLASYAKRVIETWGYCAEHLLPAGHEATEA